MCGDAMKKYFLLFLTMNILSACQTSPTESTLYAQLGGEAGIATIVDNFITEISYDPVIMQHFQDTSLQRFRSKQIEHMCQISDGPCRYTGDSMVNVHQKMQITESEFNRIVDLLINAMNKANVPLQAQNRLLARMKGMRKDIIYH